MTLNEIANAIHINAVKHGWWDTPREIPEIIALCHAELSEALEEYRDGKLSLYYMCGEGLGIPTPCNPKNIIGCENYYKDKEGTCPYRKPEGLPVELVDCIIRILDYCAFANIDIDEVIRLKHTYNLTRPYKHGGKKC